MLFSSNDTELPRLSLSCTTRALPGVILLYGSLAHRCIFPGVIPVGETISVSHNELFHCSQNLCCDDLQVPAAVSRGVGLGVAALRAGAVGASGQLLGLGLSAHGGGDRDGAGCDSCGSFQGVMVTGPVVLGALWGLLSPPATDGTLDFILELLFQVTRNPALAQRHNSL